jgi:uncharacterized protein
LGGVPAYLERWRDNESLKVNVERLFLQRTGWFRNEPQVLVSDLTERETVNYEAILKAIAAGHHEREAVAAYSAVKSAALSHYLPRLLDLRFVERRIPATTPLTELTTSRKTRYYLRDPFLRFYYRFLDPNLHLLDGSLSHRLWQMIEDNFRAFVALTFEEICLEWTTRQAQRGKLPFAADNVGAHWSATVQVDLVAINWRERQILLEECKWEDAPVGRRILTELIAEKTAKVLADLPGDNAEWTVHYAFFAWKAFTDAARELAGKHGAILLTLPQLEAALGDSFYPAPAAYRIRLSKPPATRRPVGRSPRPQGRARHLAVRGRGGLSRPCLAVRSTPPISFNRSSLINPGQSLLDQPISVEKRANFDPFFPPTHWPLSGPLLPSLPAPCPRKQLANYLA